LADIHIGQVIKQYQGKWVIGVLSRMAQGTEDAAITLLAKSKGGTKLNKAYIERLNATFRSRLSCLIRRSRALLLYLENLPPLEYLMGCIYNFCTEHRLPNIVCWPTRLSLGAAHPL
jgi:hypothetical protein